MSTRRLYWEDPLLRSWRSTVLQQRADGFEVALDQTAFYPKGGGQPADGGFVNGIQVLDVQSEADVVWHRLAEPLDSLQVMCELDWQRRLDHMQQHHGQHLLSAGFEMLYGARTTAFHLGAVATTIDLAVDSLSDAQLVAVEEWVNDVIWRDLPVEVRFVEGADLDALPLRKPPKVLGVVRVVSVEGVDYSACGGTHPLATGGVGLLHIRRTEKRGAELRVEFVCGVRALRDYRSKAALMMQLAADFSVAVEDTPAAVARLREAEHAARKQLEQAQKMLLDYQAVDLLAQAESLGSTPVVSHVWDELAPEQMRYLAKLLTDQAAVAVLASAGPKPQLLIAGDQTGLHCGMLLRETTAAFAGRGGGSATLAQGGVADAARLHEAVQLAKQQLKLLLG